MFVIGTNQTYDTAFVREGEPLDVSVTKFGVSICSSTSNDSFYCFGPSQNYTNVVEACRAMIDRTRWNLAHGRVTVSTVGLISQIRKLTKELPEVSLALVAPLVGCLFCQRDCQDSSRE